MKNIEKVEGTLRELINDIAGEHGVLFRLNIHFSGATVLICDSKFQERASVTADKRYGKDYHDVCIGWYSSSHNSTVEDAQAAVVFIQAATAVGDVLERYFNQGLGRD